MSALEQLHRYLEKARAPFEDLQAIAPKGKVAPGFEEVVTLHGQRYAVKHIERASPDQRVKVAMLIRGFQPTRALRPLEEVAADVGRLDGPARERLLAVVAARVLRGDAELAGEFNIRTVAEG
jgi:hypothetical protein